MARFWLSFADDDGFRGVVLTEAPGFLEAVSKCNLLGINPGGQVYGPECPDDFHIPPQAMDRLLSKEEVYQFFPDAKTVYELEAES